MSSPQRLKGHRVDDSVHEDGHPPTFALQRVHDAHPHDVLANPDGSLIVAQFASGKTYPLKLERI